VHSASLLSSFVREKRMALKRPPFNLRYQLIYLWALYEAIQVLQSPLSTYLFVSAIWGNTGAFFHSPLSAYLFVSAIWGNTGASVSAISLFICERYMRQYRCIFPLSAISLFICERYMRQYVQVHFAVSVIWSVINNIGIFLRVHWQNVAYFVPMS
jgi:hypothetical protein